MNPYPQFNDLKEYVPPTQYQNINDTTSTPSLSVPLNNSHPSAVLNPYTQPINSTYPANPINPYTQPINPLPQISNNQTQLDTLEINNLKATLKSNGQFISCPYCKHQSVTRAEQQCSVWNVLCCALLGGLPWVLFQGARNKDMNCYDAEHFCIRCGVKISEYKAC